MSKQTNEKIGVSTATITGVNAMIGAGIFTVPAVLAASVGPAGIVTYAFSIGTVLFIALSLARVAQLFPQEGSFYNYAKQWAGHVGGMIAAFSYFIGLIIGMGLLLQVAGAYLHAAPFGNISPYWLGLGTLVVLTILNIVGVKLSELGQQVLIVTTSLPLIIITGMCLTKINFSYLVPFAPHGYTNILRATKEAMFGLFGFESAASLFSIVRNPGRNVPRALTYSIIIVGILYILFVGSIVLSVPLIHFASPDMTISQVLQTIFPDQKWTLYIIHISILSAIIGTLHSMIWSSGSLLYTLGRTIKNKSTRRLVDKGFFSARMCVLIVSVLILISYVTLKNANLFFSLTAITIVLAYIMAMITLLKVKSERTPGRLIQTTIGLLTAVVIFAFAFEGLINALG